MLHSGDIVLVKFPYAETVRFKYRPAVVISNKAFHKQFDLCWVVMITSAQGPAWAGDIAVAASAKTGLEMDSIIRPCKMATLQIDAVEKIGQVSAATMRNIHSFISKQT